MTAAATAVAMVVVATTATVDGGGGAAVAATAAAGGRRPAGTVNVFYPILSFPLLSHPKLLPLWSVTDRQKDGRTTFFTP